MVSGLNVQVRPLTATLTSPVGNTLTTLPTCPKAYTKKIGINFKEQVPTTYTHADKRKTGQGGKHVRTQTGLSQSQD